MLIGLTFLCGSFSSDIRIVTMSAGVTEDTVSEDGDDDGDPDEVPP